MKNKFRNKLRTNPWLMQLNSAYKSSLLKKQYQGICSYYQKKKILVEKINSVGSYRNKDKHHILYVGTDSGQDYSGLLQGLGKIADYDVFENNMTGYGLIPVQSFKEDRFRIQNGDILRELVNKSNLSTHPYSTIIGQMWAFRMDVSALDDVRDQGYPIVNISMDDRHAFLDRRMPDGSWGGTYGLIGHIDLACTAAPECVDWYRKEGCPAIYLTEASDPEFFRSMPELPKLHDVCFVGWNYGIREQLVRELRRAGLKVITFGRGWRRGHIPADDIPKVFAQSKIILGVGTIRYTKDFYALKMRDFDGPMSGSMYLTHDNKDLYDLYRVGEEIVTYKTVEECVEKAEYYCRNDDEREMIAAKGRCRSEKDHTWAQRFERILLALHELGKLP